MTDHDQLYNECAADAGKLGIDVEDIVWLVGCDDVGQMKRYLSVFSVFPHCMRSKLVGFMSKHEIRIPWFNG